MRTGYQLNDKYELEAGQVYLTGVQALVRLPLDQMRRDRRAGLKTGCFISGYEGSPLGGYDLALGQIAGLLAQHNIVFRPGVNEDLAATAVSGSQLLETLPRPTVDGVVGLWYGKGPGVDRSGDAFRHANLAGTGRNSGALALAGDDHVSKSSTIPHQSELALYSAGMPTLAAATTQDVLDLGLYGIALSRYCGAWAALKLATDVCDGGGTIEVSPERCPTVEPVFEINGRPWRKTIHPLLIAPGSLDAERDLYEYRLEAARRFAYENRLNRIETRRAGDRFGIVACGKAYADLQTALRNMALDEEALAQAGVRILRLGMVYPLEPRVVREFVEGLETVLVVEEKRSFVELQLRELLFNEPHRPRVFGKEGPEGETLLPAWGEMDAEVISRALGRFLADAPGVRARLERLDEIDARYGAAMVHAPLARTASYCSGCPHNRSTIVLEGQIAGGGIGCHGMSARMADAGRGVAWLGQMGSEGGHWIGAEPFTETPHLFQNLGDGTYFHSGRQGVLAAAQAGVNITFKILHNGVVAMTGGQDAAGSVSIPAMTRELEACGVKKILLLSDDPEKYDDAAGLAANVEVRDRETLERSLRELEKVPGATALIYDQMCANEKRRRRSRGKMAQPTRRLMIHERVCEGCGDCIKKSNCVSLEPTETEYGAKTRIHQSSCNVDQSCLLGDCPSFVEVEIAEGSGLKRRKPPELPPAEVPAPTLRAWEGSYHVLMPGIGGTGVVTINALLATAALLDGLHVVTLDQTGLAQKGGAVVSHLSLSRAPRTASQRISDGAADLLLGFDALGAAAPKTGRLCDPSRTVAVVNTHQTPTGPSIRAGLTVLAAPGALERTVNQATHAEENLFLDATRLAEGLFGSHLQANLFLTGAAWQKGLLPISEAAIEEAIRLNGVAVERNRQAFGWGRAYAADPERVEALVKGEPEAPVRTLDELIEARAAELAQYQDEAYAGRYRELVEKVRRAERSLQGGAEPLTEAVARNLFKLMAYKDEYEVARLLVDPAFERRILETFERPQGMAYRLHPPLLRSFGVERKLRIGSWARPLLRLLASFKRLRGTAFDPFGRLASRRLERELVGWYRETVESLLAGLTAVNRAQAVEIAQAPDGIRGYEGVKEASAARVRARVADQLARLARRPAA
ncbi:MAG: indolepyruvate ferredoxin oxidoreductase family protein [Acidobacteria bacterium]|nr:indolepyruvate ferredoxin oxidoreductase family protein [Acidobacteriota bacterium]